MKAVVKFAPGMEGIELRDVEKPAPKPNELLVKIMAAGICGTDLHIAHDEYAYFPPVTMGHEYTGVVEAIGAEVQGFEVGDQVVSLTAAVTCGRCRYCKQGLLMLCDQRRSIGSGVNGAMAQYMVVPYELAFKLPPEVSGTDVMALGEPLTCVVRAVIEKSKLKAGDVVLVSGPGTVGQLTAMVAKMQGAYVIMSGIPDDAARLELALELGADAIASTADQLEAVIAKVAPDGVDVAFECAGAAPSLQTCIDALVKTGNLSQIGLYGKPVPADLDQIVMKEIELTATIATEPTSWAITMQLAAQGRLDKLDRLITNRVPLDDWEQAFDMVVNKVGFKTVIVP